MKHHPGIKYPRTLYLLSLDKINTILKYIDHACRCMNNSQMSDESSLGSKINKKGKCQIKPQKGSMGSKGNVKPQTCLPNFPCIGISHFKEKCQTTCHPTFTNILS